MAPYDIFPKSVITIDYDYKFLAFIKKLKYNHIKIKHENACIQYRI